MRSLGLSWRAAALVALLAAPVAAQQRPAATPPRDTTPVAAARPTRADTAGRVQFLREVYRYPRDGRRDPFASLIATGDIRPILADLVVTGIMYDPSGRTSVAMLLDVSTDELYRARVGSVFGRIRVTAIRQREVAVTVDEFGFTRQETLSFNVTSPVRTP